MSAPHIILSSLPSLCQKNYQSWWKFDEVLKNHFCTVFWGDTVYKYVSIRKRYILAAWNLAIVVQ